MAISDTRESASARARAALLAALTLFVLVDAREAAAGDAKPDEAATVDACAEASEKGQERRDLGKLIDARASFVACAADACPDVIRRDCAEWLADVDKKIPSIVVRARDSEGRDQADVRVFADGKEVAPSLDGRAISLDPGPRSLRFERAGAEAVQESILLREGEKSRLVDIVISGGERRGAPDAPRLPSGAPFSIPVGSWVLGGVAVLGGAGFTYFGLRAKNDVDQMRSTCAPRCDPARVDAARRDVIIANVALGAGVAALGAAVVLAFVGGPPRAAPPALTAASARSVPQLHINAAPLPSGGVLIVRAQF